MKKPKEHQYSTDVHDVHTMTLEEYNNLEKRNKLKTMRGHTVRGRGKVYFHQSPLAGNGDRVW